MPRLSKKDLAMLTIVDRRGASIVSVGPRRYAIVPIQAAPVSRLLQKGLLTYAHEDPCHLVISEAGRAALEEALRG